jgi:23S rRNA (cytosine1962-C5)-methyltransferase
MARLILKQDREKSLLRRHPWIFSGAIHKMDDNIASGETIDLISFNGQFLARASYSPMSQIRARVWTFKAEPIDKEFFRRRIRNALGIRNALSDLSRTDSMRLVFAESDNIPGLIVDKYNDTLVMQCLTAGAEFWREAFAELLLEELGLKDIYERSDADVRELEGLQPCVGPLRGNPSESMDITEHGLQFKVNLTQGHKTGYYLDQRLNRQRVREMAKDRDVLDCFCYTGGFTVNALAGGAKSVVSVDSSANALDLCRENIALNNLPSERQSTLERDVFQLLRKFRDEARSFDMIILDPPKFAPTSAQVEKATRAYKDINLLAFKLLRPGGLLFTFSCSGGVDAGLFQKIIAGAALDANVDAQIIEHLSQSPDHPILLNFPEGMYLKGLVCVRN